MLQTFIAFITALSLFKPVHTPRVAPALDAIVAVVNTRGCIPFKGLTPEEQCIKTVKLYLRWSLSESNLLASPPGNNDKGAACGVMQVNYFYLREWTCKEVRKDLFKGYAEAHRIVLEGVALCGTVERAMGYYSTGKCGGAPGLVRSRCADVDGC